MKRITITLTDDLGATVEREARRRKVSISQVVRDAPETRFEFAGLPRKLSFEALGSSGEGSTTARDFEDVLTSDWARQIERDMRDPPKPAR